MKHNDYIQLSLFDDEPPKPFAVPRDERLDGLFARLAGAKFRSGFRLTEDERAYARQRGPEVIRRHALEIIDRRLAPAFSENDGRQTPMRGHPVFKAQHATGTCCRECLYKWHKIPPGRELTQPQRDYIADVILAWIARQTEDR